MTGRQGALKEFISNERRDPIGMQTNRTGTLLPAAEKVCKERPTQTGIYALDIAWETPD